MVDYTTFAFDHSMLLFCRLIVRDINLIGDRLVVDALSFCPQLLQFKIHILVQLIIT